VSTPLPKGEDAFRLPVMQRNWRALPQAGLGIETNRLRIPLAKVAYPWLREWRIASYRLQSLRPCSRSS
jgi:hypothetical protein